MLLFNLASMLLVYPAMISLDIHRRKAQRSDLLCCILPDRTEIPLSKRPLTDQDGKLKKKQAVTRALPPDRNHTVTSVMDKVNQINFF